MDERIPVIDLFAGPGGLGEGFATLHDDVGDPVFHVALSVEMDEAAHRTLELRALFRRLRAEGDLRGYFDYVTQARPSEASRTALFKAHSDAAETARRETWCHRLTDDSREETTRRSRRALRRESLWVLVGGPPCQAYSLVGRSRRANDASFGADEKHTLYLHYLHLIDDLRPPVFVLENVKGMLSASLSEENTFAKVMRDLECAGRGYRVVPFVERADESAPFLPSDYVIRAEAHGVPQSRHRVVLFGVERGLDVTFSRLRPGHARVATASVLRDLPRLRSRLSGRDGTRRDSNEAWFEVLEGAAANLRRERLGLAKVLKDALAQARAPEEMLQDNDCALAPDDELAVWYAGCGRVPATLNHEPRSHRADDIERYLFCAAYASKMQRSPKLDDFPAGLRPRHSNVADGKFVDRFRVQLAGQPASTVTSHISKDGHYYIHYDPSQCRALTVREAARLQTFPDDYFFEGTRTQQYHQVGNAVPPFLARQIAAAVADCLGARSRSRNRST